MIDQRNKLRSQTRLLLSRILTSPVRYRRKNELNVAKRRLLENNHSLTHTHRNLLTTVKTDMHPYDNMYEPGTARHYLKVGLSAVACIDRVLQHAKIEQIDSVLRLSKWAWPRAAFFDSAFS